MHKIVLIVLVVLGLGSGVAAGQGELPPAPLVNDEGGPVMIRGEVGYTNPLFTQGVAQPLIILEDQAGFVDRNRFYVFPPESQALGQITSDFFISPFSYELALPIQPQGTLRDVDNDGEKDQGVMIFAVAYWSNIFGDPFLEERDLFGGGWSTAYVSTRVSPDPSAEFEIVGGTYLVFALDDEQGFPSGFGEDGLLFTGDEPLVRLPQGYTIVNLDTEPFTFDRSRNALIDLLEGESAAADDFSGLSYTEAFDAMLKKMRREYAFTEFKGIDWDQLSAEFRPRFAAAEADNDARAYRLALRDFTWSIPDGHVAGPFGSLFDLFAFETEGGLGIAISELDDGRVIVSFLQEGSPADAAGIALRAEILAIDDLPIAAALDATVPWSSPFSTDHFRRLQQLRYATRFPSNTAVELTYRNPGAEQTQTVTLTTVNEGESFAFSSFNVGLTGFEQPLEFELLPEGIGYVKIFSFSDNELLTVQLWERMINALNANGVRGLIIDMRQNGGGSGFLADQMAAYFFDQELTLGNTGFYDESLDDFFFDSRGEGRFILPSADLRYRGEVAVLVGPNCASACEFFSYDMTVRDRAEIVGQYPTAGLGGSVEDFFMPEGETVRFTIGREVDAQGNIHIEGQGVAPTIRVPVDEETLFSPGDPVLEAAIDFLIGG